MYMYIHICICICICLCILIKDITIYVMCTHVDTKMLLVGFKQPVPIDDLKLVTAYQTIQISDAFVIL